MDTKPLVEEGRKLLDHLGDEFGLAYLYDEHLVHG